MLGSSRLRDGYVDKNIDGYMQGHIYRIPSTRLLKDPEVVPGSQTAGI